MREQSVEAFEVAVGLMWLVGLGLGAVGLLGLGVGRQLRPLAVALVRREPLGMARILNQKQSPLITVNVNFYQKTLTSKHGTMADMWRTISLR